MEFMSKWMLKRILQLCSVEKFKNNKMGCKTVLKKYLHYMVFENVFYNYFKKILWLDEFCFLESSLL